MACVAVNSLVRTIEIEFLQSQPRPVVQENELISRNKHLIQSLHEKLGFLMELLDEKRMDNGVEAIKDLETKLRDLAFRVEDEIELQIVDLEEEFGVAGLFLDTRKTWPSLKLGHVLQQAIQDIDAIEEELETIKKGYEVVQRRKSATKSEVDYSPQSDEDKMVGKDEEFEIVKKMLIEHSSRRREVVAIMGMGGIGKTTLARRAYDDSSIFPFHFDKRAWVVASQHYNKRQMLVSLLNSISKLESHVESTNDEELALRVYQGLKHQRYLVVMDDVWSEETWDAIQTCFPDDKNGSRVLLTTRLASVADYTCTNNDFSHQMHLLSQSESWNLFCEKAHNSHGVEFEAIGRQIVDKCKGLPLAIVVVAGLFFKHNTLDEWKNSIEALKSSSTTFDKECSKILSLSYNHLPHNLRCCFLYLGVFPEDHEIDANNLARLWAAEGLIKAFENQSIGAMSKRYLQELAERNLILVSKRSSCGRKVKTFRIHDLLHTFCIREAQDQNILFVAGKNGSNFPRKGFRWVSIQSLDFDITMLYSFPRNCRSIFYFPSQRYLPSQGYIPNVTSNLNIFNLLRVLFSTKDGLHMNWEIVGLIHLRYLSLIDVKLSIPAWNLQTLDILYGYNVNYSEFPQLQYVRSDAIGGDGPEFLHQNLQNISELKTYHSTKEFFKNIPYLKKVGISGWREDCNGWIENLVSLEQLERLYIRAEDWDHPYLVTINDHIERLKNLHKLSFWNMYFAWNGINVLVKLPKLQVLKLAYCLGEEWELPENEEFHELIFLKMGRTDLKHWKARGDHFPKLERLVLFDCNKLEGLPIEFAEISELKSIELLGCQPSAVTSAREIQEEQHDYGNNDMVVIEEDTIQVSLP